MMEARLCRICGKTTDNHVNIFRTEGLKEKLETCLPIVVSQHCLLPDTICTQCEELVKNFYNFIKNCLQNLIILESKYDIYESSLRSKRKLTKGTSVEQRFDKCDKFTQTDEIDPINTYRESINLSRHLEESERLLNRDSVSSYTAQRKRLVDYAQSDDSSCDSEGAGCSAFSKNVSRWNVFNLSRSKLYFDNQENTLIERIVERIGTKRKCEGILPYKPKMCKYDISRRKSRRPKKLDVKDLRNAEDCNSSLWNMEIDQVQDEVERSPLLQNSDEQNQVIDPQIMPEHQFVPMPQVCLLCDSKFEGASLLAAHVFQVHGIDMAKVMEPIQDKKKKIPNLVKITDLKIKNDSEALQSIELHDEPPTLQPSYACPVCPALLSSKSDLYTHLRIKHSEESSLACGLCTHIASSCATLNDHLEVCSQQHPILNKYFCKTCRYSDDSFRTVENHIVAHGFLLESCTKDLKMFDPTDYVQTNENCDVAPKVYSCAECGCLDFEDFREFSAHRRSQHQIFHCDLCNKYYGRNSHLWKHVNRLHKGHPSITCQLCRKTSASKYHLAQHFAKIHQGNGSASKSLLKSHQRTITSEQEEFMHQKFQGFDFQSVKQSFLRQELLESEKVSPKSEQEDVERDVDSETEQRENSNIENESIFDDDKNDAALPKEIDSSSNLYTNIITNYTPRHIDGEFKCPKCHKGFQKKHLVKKHKKNCRPKLQKDLLTRCKTCSRIFKDRQSLAKHLINYHSEYTCEICSQKFQSKCEIVSHIRFTHPNCHLFCSCGNILRSKEDLASHTQDHRNSFVCQFCGDSLPTKIKLKMHILSLHRKILSLSCGICLKLFETQHILRDHVRLAHRDDLQPLTSCTVCGKNYGSKWKTFDHLNKSHGRIFKACKACLEVFDSEPQLQEHYELSHMKFSSGQNKVHNPFSGHTPNASTMMDVKQEYESDFEDKNIVSDGSDYIEYSPKEFGDVNLEFSPKDTGSSNSPRKVNEFSSVTSDNKISLLEKRLLGEKVEDLPMKKQLKKVKKKKMSTSPRKVVDDSEAVQNPQYNSSKRTVYVNSNDPSLCEICLKTWPAKKHLWQHYIRCHKSVAATVCGICLKATESYEALQVHLAQTHPTLLHGQGIGSNFICRICGRYHNASSKLKLHMVIHENFDWSILSSFKNDDGEKINNGGVEEKGGLKTSTKQDEYGLQNEINYESMIEQVECSSEESDNESDDDKLSSNDDDDDEDNEDSSSSDDSDDDDGDSIDMSGDENSLESQMLQNMLIEKNQNEYQVKAQNQVSSGGRRDRYESSSESENSSNSTEYFDGVKRVACLSEESGSEDDREEGVSNDSEVTRNPFMRKSEELDSAIKSISYERMADDREQLVEQFCEIQSHNLNVHEIQTAVDSIL